MLLNEVKSLVTIRGGQVPCYYQRRSSTFVTIRGQVPCYYQRRSSTLLLSVEVKYIVTIRGAQYLVTIRGGQVPCYNQGQTNW